MKHEKTKTDKQIEKLSFYRKTDKVVTGWMRRHGLTALRISIGIVFFWFGFLKFFPGFSPAETLAVNTISAISLDLLPHRAISIGLAVWEVMIGIGLLTGRWMRLTLLLLFLQMPGTFLPVFLFPYEVFKSIPFVPTMEGQYIFKNLVLISAGIVLGGFLEPRPTGGIEVPEKED